MEWHMYDACYLIAIYVTLARDNYDICSDTLIYDQYPIYEYDIY